MKTKSSQSKTTADKSAQLKKQTIRDLTVKQAGGVKGGVLKKRMIRVP